MSLKFVKNSPQNGNRAHTAIKKKYRADPWRRKQGTNAIIEEFAQKERKRLKCAKRLKRENNLGGGSFL